jgi:DNA-binding SARP family transcriptional activator
VLSNNVLRYDVLGTFRVRRAGDELDLGWAKQQAVLATLVLEMNRYVPVDDIAAAVWGSRPPRDIRNAAVVGARPASG